VRLLVATLAFNATKVITTMVKNTSTANEIRMTSLQAGQCSDHLAPCSTSFLVASTFVHIVVFFLGERSLKDAWGGTIVHFLGGIDK